MIPSDLVFGIFMFWLGTQFMYLISLHIFEFCLLFEHKKLRK